MTIVIKSIEEEFEMEISKELISFYKKETGKTRVTKRGIQKFYNNLVYFFAK
jgi:hypothetical protein